MLKVHTYLADWTLRDDQEQKLDPRDMDVLKALRPGLFEIIEKAIDEHVKKQVAEGKAQSGTPKSETISA